jgi:tetratricopeptide (TPR) repeat protein
MTNETETLLLQAKEALEAKQYAKAEASQRQACDLMRGERADDSRLASEIEKLADIHCIQKKFDQCASEYAEVVQMREKFVPANDYNILRPLYRQAKSHFEGQKYDLAEAEMRRTLSIAETHSDSPETLAFSLYELGFLLYFVGKHSEAEPLLLKALSTADAALGGSHHQTIRALDGIARLYANSDLAKDPEPYFTRLIEVSKTKKELTETYRLNLWRFAGYMAEHQKYEQADELYLELVAVLDATEQKDDCNLHLIASSCVKYFKSRGKGELVAHLAPEGPDYGVYGDMVKGRLAHAEQALSEDDPEYAEALSAAGNHALFEGKYQEAEPLLTRAFDAFTRVNGKNSSQAVLALNRVGTIKRLLRKFDEAESAIQKAINAAKESSVDQGLYPRSLENLALLREAENRVEDAERIYEEAVADYEKSSGLASYVTAEALYHQSGCLLRMGKLRPAETAIRRAIGVMDKVEQLSGYEKSDYLGTLASILEATGRNSEAAEMKSRAQQLFEQTKKENERED